MEIDKTLSLKSYGINWQSVAFHSATPNWVGFCCCHLCDDRFIFLLVRTENDSHSTVSNFLPHGQVISRLKLRWKNRNHPTHTRSVWCPAASTDRSHPVNNTLVRSKLARRSSSFISAHIQVTSLHTIHQQGKHKPNDWLEKGNCAPGEVRLPHTNEAFCGNAIFALFFPNSVWDETKSWNCQIWACVFSSCFRLPVRCIQN